MLVNENALLRGVVVVVCGGGGGGEGGRIQSSLKLVWCIKLIIGLAGQKCLSQVTSTSRCALVNKQHT